MMIKYMMFEDMKLDTVKYPNGKIKTRKEVMENYPVFKTPYGVIGVNCNDKGEIGDIARMFFYGDIITMTDQYGEVVEFSDDMTNAQKCEAITAYENTPKDEPKSE